MLPRSRAKQTKAEPSNDAAKKVRILAAPKASDWKGMWVVMVGAVVTLRVDMVVKLAMVKLLVL